MDSRSVCKAVHMDSAWMNISGRSTGNVAVMAGVGMSCMEGMRRDRKNRCDVAGTGGKFCQC